MLGGGRIGASALAVDRSQRRLDVRLHLAAVAAHIDDRAVLDQLPDAILFRCDQVLHIGLRTVAARERGIEFGDAISRKGLQFIRVEIILFGMAAAEEQHRRPKGRPTRLGGVFLQTRAASKARGAPLGTAMLLFGCRHPEQDYLYADEL